MTAMCRGRSSGYRFLAARGRRVLYRYKYYIYMCDTGQTRDKWVEFVSDGSSGFVVHACRARVDEPSAQLVYCLGAGCGLDFGRWRVP